MCGIEESDSERVRSLQRTGGRRRQRVRTGAWHPHMHACSHAHGCSSKARAGNAVESPRGRGVRHRPALPWGSRWATPPGQTAWPHWRCELQPGQLLLQGREQGVTGSAAPTEAWSCEVLRELSLRLHPPSDDLPPQRGAPGGCRGFRAGGAGPGSRTRSRIPLRFPALPLHARPPPPTTGACRIPAQRRTALAWLLPPAPLEGLGGDDSHLYSPSVAVRGEASPHKAMPEGVLDTRLPWELLASHPPLHRGLRPPPIHPPVAWSWLREEGSVEQPGPAAILGPCRSRRPGEPDTASQPQPPPAFGVG
ncbi:uncharacterized protein LOC132249049 [Alligator mississippiensis]|uniref:uncharacterized protein LOC132249049 n=1 Tax=Alligator mississippiensis TaxID=8496 RepID=UPI0028780586|nr:uncharacterized protein LOC132249049 [Alligator mississippiensis]